MTMSTAVRKLMDDVEALGKRFDAHVRKRTDAEEGKWKVVFARPGVGGLQKKYEVVAPSEDDAKNKARREFKKEVLESGWKVADVRKIS